MTDPGHEKETDVASAERDSALVAQRLYVEHLQQRLAQSDVLRAQVFDLEREVAFLRTELRSARRTIESTERTLEATEQARAAAVQRCADNHVDKALYRSTKRQVKSLERQLRQLRASRSYRAGRLLSRVARRVVPRPDAGREQPIERTRRSSAPVSSPTVRSDSPARSPGVEENVTVVPPNLVPVTLLDCRGCDSEHIAAAAAQLGAPTDGGVTVVVQDSLDFSAARERGLRIEYIPDERGLAETVGGAIAADVVGRRWDEILGQHRPTEVYRPAAAESGVRLELVWFSTTERIA